MQRQTDRQRERDTHTDRQRQTDRQTNRALVANVLSTVKPVGHIRRRDTAIQMAELYIEILAHYHYRGVALNVCVVGGGGGGASIGGGGGGGGGGGEDKLQCQRSKNDRTITIRPESLETFEMSTSQSQSLN